MVVVSVLFASSGPVLAQNWIYTEEKDPFTDELKQFAYGIPEGYESKTSSPYVRLGCYAPKGESSIGLTIHWAAPVRDVYPDGDLVMASVQVRIGSSKPAYIGMAISDDRTMTYGMDPLSGGLSALGSALVQSILPGWEQPMPLVDIMDFHRPLYSGGDRLALRTQSAGGGEITYVIPMDGFEAATQNFRDHCVPAGARRKATATPPVATPALKPAPAAPKAAASLATKLWIPVSSETDFLANHIVEADAEVVVFFKSLTAGAADPFPSDAKIYFVKMPFYPNTYLVIGNNGHPTRRHYALADPVRKMLVVLDGTANPIHAYNKLVAPTLSLQNVGQYLWYFGFFVHGNEGAFHVADRMDGIVYSQVEGDNSADRARIADAVRPVTCAAAPSGDGFLCKAVIAHADALFAADMQVTTGGMVSMVGDSPVLQGLTMRPIRRQLR